MTDTELTLAVARAMGKDAVLAENGTVYIRTGEPPLNATKFDPLHDSQWGVKMMVWLAGRGMLVKVSPIGCLISQALEPAEFVESFADHPTRNDAIRRCLCEAAAAVGEK